MTLQELIATLSDQIRRLEGTPGAQGAVAKLQQIKTDYLNALESGVTNAGQKEVYDKFRNLNEAYSKPFDIMSGNIASKLIDSEPQALAGYLLGKEDIGVQELQRVLTESSDHLTSLGMKPLEVDKMMNDFRAIYANGLVEKIVYGGSDTAKTADQFLDILSGNPALRGKEKDTRMLDAILTPAQKANLKRRLGFAARLEKASGGDVSLMARGQETRMAREGLGGMIDFTVDGGLRAGASVLAFFIMRGVGKNLISGKSTEKILQAGKEYMAEARKPEPSREHLARSLGVITGTLNVGRLDERSERPEPYSQPKPSAHEEAIMIEIQEIDKRARQMLGGGKNSKPPTR